MISSFFLLITESFCQSRSEGWTLVGGECTKLAFFCEAAATVIDIDTPSQNVNFCKIGPTETRPTDPLNELVVNYSKKIKQ
jgi:hypothetical protein